ncbi:MAG: hypothetical protein M5U21_13410, partial [Fimbriimonadaceae bacterium]|nr:hypothetical protein [Fimbriimonadaceae bacterium]
GTSYEIRTARRGLGGLRTVERSVVTSPGSSASYASKGLGGSRNAARRMGGAAARSGVLFGALDGLSDGTFDLTQLGFDSAGLAGRSAREIIDRVARFVSPSDGTQDAESSQRAVNAALSDLLENDQTVDITSLTEQQIDWVLERHVAYEIVQRIELDVGKAIVDNAPSAAAAIDRLNEMRDYVEATVAAAFRSHRRTNRLVDASAATRLARTVMQETFGVFEEYLG